MSETQDDDFVPFKPKHDQGTGYEWVGDDGLPRAVSLFEGQDRDIFLVFKRGEVTTPLRLGAVATVVLSELLTKHCARNFDELQEELECLNSNPTKD